MAGHVTEGTKNARFTRDARILPRAIRERAGRACDPLRKGPREPVEFDVRVARLGLHHQLPLVPAVVVLLKRRVLVRALRTVS